MLPPASGSQVAKKRAPGKATEEPAGKRPAPATAPATATAAAGEQDQESSSGSDQEEEEEDDEGEESSSIEDDAEEPEAQAEQQTPESASDTRAKGVAPRTTRLYKLGEYCCEIVATFAGGHQQPLPFGESLAVDQRAKLDRCRSHIEWAGGLATIWRLNAAKKSGTKAYLALSNYFINKQRVGLIEADAFEMYIVPPDAKFLQEVGLAGPVVDAIVGIQVPTSKDE